MVFGNFHCCCDLVPRRKNGQREAQQRLFTVKMQLEVEQPCGAQSKLQPQMVKITQKLQNEIKLAGSQRFMEQTTSARPETSTLPTQHYR